MATKYMVLKSRLELYKDIERLKTFATFACCCFGPAAGLALILAVAADANARKIQTIKQDAVSRGYADYDGETFNWKDGE